MLDTQAFARQRVPQRELFVMPPTPRRGPTHPAEQRDSVRRGAVAGQDGGAAAEAEGHLRDLSGRQAELLRFGALRVLRRQRRDGERTSG